MVFITALFLAVYLVSSAALIGGWFADFENPTVSKPQWWGSIGMLGSVIVLAVFEEIGSGDANHLKIATGVVLTVAVFVGAWMGRRKENRGLPISTSLAHGVGALSLLNLLIAVLWV